MSNKIYLIDTNSLIEPFLKYYPFDFAPGFWEQMARFIEIGKIAVLDLVKNELLQGNDKLRDWVSALEMGAYIDRRQPPIIEKYSAVLQYIQSNPCYKISALQEWSKGTVADPWLIATAAVNHYTIVTFEKPNNGLNARAPSKNAKIPDVASEFGVEAIDLYSMMRELGFMLH